MDAATHCTRCGGFVIPEAFRDIGIATVGWHCLLCGETVDDVILRNRARPIMTPPMAEEMIEWDQTEGECGVGANEGDSVDTVRAFNLP